MIIITASSVRKSEQVRILGADYTINYLRTMPDWANEVMRFTAGTGGPVTLKQSIRCVAAGGNISAIGVLSSTTDESRLGQTIGVSLIRKNATLKGINVRRDKDRGDESLSIPAASAASRD